MGEFGLDFVFVRNSMSGLVDQPLGDIYRVKYPDDDNDAVMKKLTLPPLKWGTIGHENEYKVYSYLLSITSHELHKEAKAKWNEILARLG